MPENSSNILGSTVGINISVDGGGEHPAPPVDLAALRSQAEQSALSSLVEQGRRDLNTPQFARDFEALAASHLAALQQPQALPEPPAPVGNSPLSTPPFGFSDGSHPSFVNGFDTGGAANGFTGDGFTRAVGPEAGGAEISLAEIGGGGVWSSGPTDLVPPSYSMTRYSARSQYRQDESGNYQNWRFGEGGFRAGQDGGGPRGPHPDWNGGRARDAYDAPAWEADPPPQDAEYADPGYVEGQFTPRDRMAEMHEDFRSSLGTDDDEIYGPGLGGRFRKGLDRFGASPLGTRLSKGMSNYNAPYALGGGLLELGSGISRLYDEENSGVYLTPEQRETASAGLLPGIGSTVGAAVGLFAGNPMLGAMAGGAVGQVASGVIGAGDAREQAGRELSERLNASLGGTADALEKLRAAADATGAPLQQLGQGLSTLQGFAPGAGAEAVAGAGRSALAQGEYFAADTATTGKFLASNPALAPLTADYVRRGSELSRGTFQGIASLALSEGDEGAFNTAMMQAGTAARNNDPQYQTAAATLAGRRGEAGGAGNLLVGADLWFHKNWPAWLGGGGAPDDITRADDTLQARTKALGTEAKADSDRYTDEFLSVSRGRQDLVEAGFGTKVAETGFSLAEVTGASAATLRGRLPGIRAAYNAASAADQTLIDTDTGLMNRLNPKDFQDPKDYAAVREGFLADINRARADQIGNPLAIAQSARTVLGSEIEEAGAFYGFTAAGQRASVTRGLLAGKTYSALQGDEDALIGGERGRAAQVRQEAANPLLKPADRFGMLAQATGMETEADSQAYGYKLAGYSQTLGGLDARTAEAGAGVTQARLFGTPDAVYGAQGTEVEALTGKLRELTAEISRGGLAVDDLNAKTRERASAETQLAQAVAQRRDDRLAAGDALASDAFRSDTAGLSRSIRVGGSGAADIDAVNRDFGGIFAADRARINAFAPGTVQRRDAEAKYSEDEARGREFEDGLNQFTPIARTATANLRAEGQLDSARHAFRRTLEAPFLDGSPDADPLTRGLGLEREIGAGLTRVGTEQAAETAFRASRQGKVDASGHPLWDDLAEEHYAGDMEGFRARREGLLDERQTLVHDRMFAFERMLPEMIAGAGGSGTISGVIPTKGQASFFNASPFITGSWGQPGRAPNAAEDGGHSPLPGGVAGGFLAMHGGLPAAGDQGSAAVVAEIRLLRQAIERGMSAGGRSAAVTNRNPNLAFNPYKQAPGQ